MKHKGKAREAGFKIIWWTLILLVAVLIGGIAAVLIGSFLAAASGVLIAVWAVFALFALYFFRDPDPVIPTGSSLVLSPAHGTVDVIDEVEETEFLGGPCRRISIFLSVFDVHVQRAPISGVVSYLEHHPGEFLNAMNLESASRNENVMIGLEPADPSGAKIAVRLIAGLIARRIVPWLQRGESVQQGERVSLIQFGSRCDVYLPLSVIVNVKIGDKVKGGHSILAKFT
jgi:phosphatidylserine decarboxylase